MLRTIFAQHPGNPNLIAGEDALPSLFLRSLMAKVAPPRQYRIFIPPPGERQNFACRSQALKTLNGNKTVNIAQQRSIEPGKEDILAFTLIA